MKYLLTLLLSLTCAFAQQVYIVDPGEKITIQGRQASNGGPAVTYKVVQNGVQRETAWTARTVNLVADSQMRIEVGYYSDEALPALNADTSFIPVFEKWLDSTNIPVARHAIPLP